MLRRDGFVNGFSVALGAATLALFLWLGWRLLGAVAEIITPFVIGIVFALILNPIVAKVQARYTRGKRGRAVTFVFCGFLAVFIGLVAWLVPTVIGQTGRLIHFFAPLSYRIEQRVPGSGPKVLEDDFGQTAYTVHNLENGKRYAFRVIATDADGHEYRLRSVSSVPSTRQVASSNDDASTSSGRVRQAAPTPKATATPRRTVTPQPVATPSVPAETPSATPAPRPTVSAHTAALLPRPSVLPSVPSTTPVSPSPSPGIRDDTGNSGTQSDDDFGDEQTSENNDGGSGAEATPTPEPTTFPLLVPGTRDGASATPRPTPVPTATPDEAQDEATPVATATPQATPEATPTPHASTLVGRLSQVGEQPSSKAGGSGNGAIRLLDTADPVVVKPGTIVATPGSGSVRLNWRPPADVKSGFDRLRIQADTWLTEHRKIGPVTLPANLATLQSQYSDRVSGWVQGLVRNIASTIIGSIGILITIVLIPLVTLYVLNDMERLRGRLLFFLPERARIEFVRVTSDVGEVFGNYIRGMATVSAIYGAANFALFLGLGLLFNHGLAGYAILLGFIAGVLYPVPYIGPTTTTLVAGTVALATGHSLGQTGIIVGLALALNQIFDNFLVPRLVGKSVGLHPLLTLFALLLGGNLFGLWGMLLSVPVAASIQLILFRLFPRFGAPTPIAYLMPDRRPQEDNKNGDAANRNANRDLLKTPEALTDDKPNQSLVKAGETDVTGNVPLGPVPTYHTGIDPKAPPPPTKKEEE